MSDAKGAARVAVGFAALLTLATPITVVAAPPTANETEAQRKQRAVTLVDEGVHQFDKGNFEAAYERFTAAYDAFPSPKILLNVGHSLKKLHREAEAAQAYDRFLTETAATPDIGEEKLRTARDGIRELSSKVGRFHLDVTPPDANISLDGKPLGPMTKLRVIYAADGMHTIAAEREGFLPRSFSARARKNAEDKFTLSLDIDPKTQRTVEVPVRVEVPHKRVYTWVAGGSAVILLGAGLGFGLHAGKLFDDLGANSKAYQALPMSATEAMKATLVAKDKDLRSSITRESLIANVLFATAGAAAITSAVLFVIEGKARGEHGETEAPPPGPTIMPTLDHPGAALSVTF